MTMNPKILISLLFFMAPVLPSASVAEEQKEKQVASTNMDPQLLRLRDRISVLKELRRLKKNEAAGEAILELVGISGLMAEINVNGLIYKVRPGDQFKGYLLLAVLTRPRSVLLRSPEGKSFRLHGIGM